MTSRGAYLLSDPSSASGPALLDDPRLARIRAAWGGLANPGRHEGKHEVIIYSGDPVGMDHYHTDQAVPCDDGLVYLPPKDPTPLEQLERPSIPEEVSVVELRRARLIVPLGVGPVFGIGRRIGQPSTPYGQLAVEVDNWTHDNPEASKAGEIPIEIARKFERLYFEAAAQCYHVTWEQWAELAVYDSDEGSEIICAIWGIDPKSIPDADDTSPPSGQD